MRFLKFLLIPRKNPYLRKSSEVSNKAKLHIYHQKPSNSWSRIQDTTRTNPKSIYSHTVGKIQSVETLETWVCFTGVGESDWAWSKSKGHCELWWNLKGCAIKGESSLGSLVLLNGKANQCLAIQRKGWILRCSHLTLKEVNQWEVKH